MRQMKVVYTNLYYNVTFFANCNSDRVDDILLTNNLKLF